MKKVSPEIYNMVVSMNHGYCALCSNKGEEVHHRLPKYKRYLVRFPLFLNSLFNLVLLCKSCHTNKTADLKITEHQATLKERFLEMVQGGEYK